MLHAYKIFGLIGLLLAYFADRCHRCGCRHSYTIYRGDSIVHERKPIYFECVHLCMYFRNRMKKLNVCKPSMFVSMCVFLSGSLGNTIRMLSSSSSLVCSEGGSSSSSIHNHSHSYTQESQSNSNNTNVKKAIIAKQIQVQVCFGSRTIFFSYFIQFASDCLLVEVIPSPTTRSTDQNISRLGNVSM